MTDTFMKYVEFTASFSTIFNEEYDRENFISQLEGLPIKELFIILSQLNYLPPDDSSIKNLFFSWLNQLKLDTTKMKKLDYLSLYNTQVLLSVWKWLLTYGKYEKFNGNFLTNDGIIKAICLCFIIADYNKKESNINDSSHDSVLNFAFYNPENLSAAIARTKYIYYDLARKEELLCMVK